VAASVYEMACFSPLKGFKDVNGGLTFKKTHLPMQVACGQCLGCRAERASVWGMRIIHEAAMHEDHYGNCWLTLTYRDRTQCSPEQLEKRHHVPDDYSLTKSHFQKFIKRLRKHYPQKIKYFYCGEYGPETKRPHYHACLFNVQIDDRTIQKLWPYGFTQIGELNYTTAAYTAGYILSKITGAQGDEEYLRSDDDGVAYWVLPPYINMSLGRKAPGGIGAEFYEKYKKDFFPADESPVPGKGILKKVPRYYETILKKRDPAALELVKELREKFHQEHKGEYTPERLRSKFIIAQSKQITRNQL